LKEKGGESFGGIRLEKKIENISNFLKECFCIEWQKNVYD